MNFNYKRRSTLEVPVGHVNVGGDNPVAVQSMTSTSTMDTPGSVAQIERIADAGGDIVRLTAQGVRESENLAEIRARVRADGYDVPLVADIHFNPKAALAAAPRVEKVRINPGNFVDPGRVFKKIDFTDEEYAAEIQKIDEALTPLIELCKAHGTTLRIGVNHGSLSDRIMSRYGDTPEGMVESAMEFIRACFRQDFKRIVVSIKASNVVVMTRTVRLMADAMDHEGYPLPLHLGVTEAGDGEDARIKSAVGIGSLLMQGLGDTIRVSLSEDPEREIEPARLILSHIAKVAKVAEAAGDIPEAPTATDYDPLRPSRRISVREGKEPVIVGLDIAEDDPSLAFMDASDPDAVNKILESAGKTVVLRARGADAALRLRSILHAVRALGIKTAVIPSINYDGLTAEETAIAASVDMGLLLLDGFADGLEIKNSAMSREQLNSLALSILQATRLRISKTEYIACPSCGRTLYDLQTALRDIKAATSHLTGLKIGVMGCIVNGPGEMADADYGYVGAGVGKVSLYKGKECIIKNIPTSEAIPRLIELIKAWGDWKDPE